MSRRSSRGQKVPPPKHPAGKYYKVRFDVSFPRQRVDRTSSFYLSRENIRWDTDAGMYQYTLGKTTFTADQIESVDDAENDRPSSHRSDGAEKYANGYDYPRWDYAILSGRFELQSRG